MTSTHFFITELPFGNLCIVARKIVKKFFLDILRNIYYNLNERGRFWQLSPNSVMPHYNAILPQVKANGFWQFEVCFYNNNVQTMYRFQTPMPYRLHIFKGLKVTIDASKYKFSSSRHCYSSVSYHNKYNLLPCLSGSICFYMTIKAELHQAPVPLHI